MPGKSKKGGGLKSSPAYKKQEFGAPFKMKSSPAKFGAAAIALGAGTRKTSTTSRKPTRGVTGHAVASGGSKGRSKKRKSWVSRTISRLSPSRRRRSKKRR